MMNLKIGDTAFVQSYKHDGKIHRTWSKALIIDVQPTFTVAVTDHTWVVESDKRKWLTREPAVCFYYEDKWYNVISMIRKNGIYYYCNLASPSLYDGEAIKNIDYDLDVKVYPTGAFTVLDENEYAHHAKVMNYPSDIKKKVEDALQDLINMIKKGAKPFDSAYINDYLLKYFKLVSRN